MISCSAPVTDLGGERGGLAGKLLFIFLLLSMQPVFFWGKDWVFAVFGILFFLSSVVLLRGRKWYLPEIFAALAVLVFFGSLFLPVREMDSFSVRHLAYLVVLLAIFLSQRSATLDAFSMLRKFFLLVVVFSLASTLLFAIGAPFPDIIISQDSRVQGSETYRLYYGMIYLNTQVYDIGLGQLVRNVGIFGEPGHFGIYICLILLLSSARPLEGAVNRILIIGALSTFSAATYAILFTIVVIKEGFIRLSFFSFLFFFSILIFGGEDLLSIVLGKFSSEGGVLASRENLEFSLYDMSGLNLIFGYGNGALDFYGFSSSNLIAFFIKYGLFGVGSFFAFLFFVSFCIYLKGERTKAISLAVVILMISLHRSWMTDSMYIWFFLIFALITSLEESAH